MAILFRRLLAVVEILLGMFFIMTFQGWGMMLIRTIGFERALGQNAVRHVGDGRVLLTNPLGMLAWSLPFIILGIAFIVVGVRTWRGGKRANHPPQLTGDASEG